MTARPDRAAVTGAALDLGCILVFVAIGRSSHRDGVTPGGLVSTAWPFVAGGAVGWLLARAWRRPLEIVPTGVAVWIACVVVGMVLRVVAGQGTAVAFVVVALAFLGLFLLGWRGLWRATRPRPVVPGEAGGAGTQSHSGRGLPPGGRA